MNSYFLHNGTDSIGPFTIQELKTMNLKSTTPVWCQGMPDWSTAIELAELKPLFTVTPPPLRKSVPKPVPAQLPVENKIGFVEPTIEKKSKRILGLNKSVFIFIAFFATLIIASFFLSLYQDNRREASELKNQETEKNNVQYRLQQKEIEEQKIQMEIQQKIENDRLLKEKKEMLNAKILANNDLLATANSNFQIAKKKLEEASNFQFFRSEEERYQEIALEQKQVSYWKKEVENITNDTDRIKLELENLH